MTENSTATQNVCSSILFAQMTLCVDLGPRANLTRIAVSSGNSARWGGSEHMNGLMTTSMTWVRDPRSTFRLPIFDKGDPALLCASQQNASPHVRFGPKADIERSISPNTMSRELSIAGTSASMCPRVKKSMAPNCGYDGARILHLYGWLVPSETR